jgi:hypothetical protein
LERLQEVRPRNIPSFDREQERAGLAALAVTRAEIKPLKEEVQATIETLCTSLPEDCATFFVEEDNSVTGGGTIFSLTPWSPEAAPIVINCIESGITLIIGKETVFEFSVRDRSQRRDALEEMQRICEAVILGRFSEIVWSKGDEVVRVDGRVCVGEQTFKSSSRHVASLFSKKKKTVVNYAPYCRIEDCSPVIC